MAEVARKVWTRMKSNAGKTGLTVDDVAAIWRIPKGTVYRWAHDSEWRRYTYNGRVYYHPDDVIATLDPEPLHDSDTP